MVQNNRFNNDINRETPQARQTMATRRTAPTRETTRSQAIAITGVDWQAKRAEQPANTRADGLRQGLPPDRQLQSQTASSRGNLLIVWMHSADAVKTQKTPSEDIEPSILESSTRMGGAERRNENSKTTRPRSAQLGLP